MKEFLVGFMFAILLGILVNTIVRFTQKIILKIKIWKGKEVIEKKLSKPVTDWEVELEELIYLNSVGKSFVWVLVLSLCILEIFDDPERFNTNNVFLKVTMVMVISIIFFSIALFLHHSKFEVIGKWNAYLLKLCTLFIFTLSALDGYARAVTSISALVISISIPIIFSFLIMKSVIDSFKNYLFQAFNFIVLILIVNLFCIGYTFGLYYWVNNNEFIDFDGEYTFFQSEEMTMLENKEWGLKEFLLLTHEGVKPFYSLVEINTDKGVTGYLPFFEFILGSIYNLTVIAFFISYSVSKLINRQEMFDKIQHRNKQFTGGDGI
ncbi:hypothetical protein [Lysinibacillus capsici]|uniref:hypothetical protein n=1 Tax=Lysinibacillus capsici TaxID=2115968 RepID=UPI003CFEAD72